jgi:hypothetical protein
MSNISREDYDRVVAGLTTQVNLEAEDATAKQATLKSAAELIDCLMGDLNTARQEVGERKAQVQELLDACDRKDAVINKMADDIQALSAANLRLAKRQSKRG